ncbi:MAG TPA: hypothetical protein V6D22_14605 [Candidatus Obscuribacterales bacterium]
MRRAPLLLSAAALVLGVCPAIGQTTTTRTAAPAKAASPAAAALAKTAEPTTAQAPSQTTQPSQGSTTGAVAAESEHRSDPEASAMVYYNYGILHYMNKDYAGAAQSLEHAVRHGLSKSSNARYVLGNSYFMTDKRDTAMSMWGDAAKMDPEGLAGIYSKYCVNWVQADNARKSAEARKPIEIKVDDSGIVGDMPKMPDVEMERPSVYEVSQWSDQIRAQYVQQAAAKIDSDTQKLDEARRVYVQAQGVVGNLVPNVRLKTETEADYKRRRDAYAAHGQQMLKPYQDAVVSYQQGLKDANQILEACRAAYKKVYSELAGR